PCQIKVGASSTEVGSNVSKVAVEDANRNLVTGYTGTVSSPVCLRRVEQGSASCFAEGIEESANPRANRSISILAVEDAQQGHGDDLQIEGKAPVAKVVQIIFNALSDRGVAPPTVYLRPARDSNLERVTEVVAIDLLQKPLHEMGSFRSRTDDAHVPP